MVGGAGKVAQDRFLRCKWKKPIDYRNPPWDQRLPLCFRVDRCSIISGIATTAGVNLMTFRQLSLTFFGTGIAVLATAQVSPRDVPNGPELQATKVTLEKEEQPLSTLLRQISGSGMRLEDRRGQKKLDPMVKLPFKNGSFWQIVDAVAREANLGLSLYQPDGVVALVDGPYRAVPLSYHGLFRNAFKQITLTEDLTSGHRSSVMNVEIAWEPRLQPFLVGLGPCEVVFSKDAAGKVVKGELRGGDQVSAAGKPALELELRLPAPKRSAANIAELKGSFHVIAPSKMLTFSFDNLKKLPQQKVVEGVTVKVAEFTPDPKINPDRWILDVKIDLPPGGPKFESHQLSSASWLSNNSIVLEKVVRDKKYILVPKVDDEEIRGVLTSTRAHVRYHFTRKMNPGIKGGNIGDWTLVYRTPGRLVELVVPFVFKDVALP